MKKRLLFKLSIITAIIMYCVSNYVKLTIIPKQSQTFIISRWHVLNDYVILPLFWLNLGILLVSCTYTDTINKKMSRISKRCMYIGITTLILYSLLSIMVLFTNFAQQSIIMFHVSVWITRHVTIFLTPGILLGIGMSNQRNYMPKINRCYYLPIFNNNLIGVCKYIIVFIFIITASTLLWKCNYQRNVQRNYSETYYDFQDDSISEIQKQIIDAFFRNGDSFVIQDLDGLNITEQFYLDNIDHYKNGDYELIRKYMQKHIKSINFEPDIIFKQQQE